MKIAYKDVNFRQKSRDLIYEINAIISDYTAQGYDLTLRQVYYQLVSKDIIDNNEKSYKNIGSLVNDGRLAGLIDWNAIVDRTRNIRSLTHWTEPKEIIQSCSHSYRTNHWEGQDNYVEVWVEKDALIGIVQRVCNNLDVPFFSCRGYVSQSEMWSGAQRLITKGSEHNSITILHLGDHDPSGKDMTRDIEERLALFGADVTIDRIALNWDQIEEFNPPPNPTKITDSRADGYIQRFGLSSWELDALKPEVLSHIITQAVEELLDKSLYKKCIQKDGTDSSLLTKMVDNWDETEEFLNGLYG